MCCGAMRWGDGGGERGGAMESWVWHGWLRICMRVEISAFLQHEYIVGSEKHPAPQQVSLLWDSNPRPPAY